MMIPIGPEDIGKLLSYICGGCIINHEAFVHRRSEIAMERPFRGEFHFGLCGELKQLSKCAKDCVVKLWRNFIANLHYKTTAFFKCMANIFASWEPCFCTRFQVQVGEINNWNLGLCIGSHDFDLCFEGCKGKTVQCIGMQCCVIYRCQCQRLRIGKNDHSCD